MSTDLRSIAAIPLLGLALTAPLAALDDSLPARAPTLRTAPAGSVVPDAYHAALTRMAGTWDVRIATWENAGANPVRGEAEADITLTLGERFLEETLSGRLHGIDFQAHGLIGYNDVTHRVETVWVDNRSNAMNRLTGSVTLPGDEFRLKGSGVVAGARRAVDLHQDIRIISADEFAVTLYSHRDGKDVKIMERVYSRK